MADNNEFFDTVATPTEEKTPGTGGDSFSAEDDFLEVNESFAKTENTAPVVNSPETTAPVDTAADVDLETRSAKSETVHFTPDETAEIAIDVIDSLQYGLFMAGHSRKLKKRIFENKDEFREALNLQFTPPESLSQDPAKLALSKKANFYTKKIEKLDRELGLSPEETAQLGKPLQKMIQSRPDLQLPPGIALMLAAAQIFGPRTVDLLMD